MDLWTNWNGPIWTIPVDQNKFKWNIETLSGCHKAVLGRLLCPM
ncbi:12652_t:CDS:2, partial [Racocetra persica]